MEVKMIKSLEDLKRIKEQALEMESSQGGQGRAHITVSMGSCGIAVGAQMTMAALLDEVKRRNIPDVTISQTGCIGLCAKEPLVSVQLAGEPKVTYGNITPERASRLILEHIVNGNPVEEWAIGKE